MRNRFRLLAALLALFAFTAAFAEQVWASACAPAAQAVAGHAAVATHPGHDCDPGMPMPGHAPQRHSRAPTGGDCPFQAAAAGGCVLFSFAAPGAAAPDPAIAPSARMIPAAQAAPDLLLASPRFRPPQA
jgi:hypothetical protein